MHIGIIIGRFPPDLIGGAELQAEQMAQQLAQRGHRVMVFTRRYHGRPYLEALDGYTICRRNELPWSGLRMVWDTFPAVWNIAHHQPDVLLCYQTLNSGLIGMVSQALLGIPMVLSIRGNREYRLGDSIIQKLLVPPIFKRAQRILVQSARIRDDMVEQLQLAGKTNLIENLRTKTAIIPNGINPTSHSTRPGDKVVFVGRLIRNKGVADLIEGMKYLPGVELLIVGDGPDRLRLEKLAEGLPVTFTGQVAPAVVADYLRRARVLVLPSHLGDGFPNVILEAIAHGVPVIATATAGIPDLVIHGETGYLYEVGDIEQMVTYLNQILYDDCLWKNLHTHSLEVVRRYSWDRVIPQVERLLCSVTRRNAQTLNRVN